MRSATTTITVTAPERYAYRDLTDDLVRAVKDAGVTEGAAIAFCAHTTCALLINEWEDGALADFRRRVSSLVPHPVRPASARPNVSPGRRIRTRAQPKLILASRFERESAFESASSMLIAPLR